MDSQLPIPNDLKTVLLQYNLIGATKGRLGDEIVKYENSNSHQVVYLKFGEGVSAKSLNLEATTLSWLGDKGLIIPKVVYHNQKGNWTYLLISGVGGLPAHKVRDLNKEDILKTVAYALHKFHMISFEKPEQLDTLDKDLEKIQQYIFLKVVDSKKFIAANEGKTPEEVFGYLDSHRDLFNKDSLTHGDYCLPNVLIDGNNFGFIDLGDCGSGDKYKDFSSMEVSIKRNFGAEWIETFYRYYDPSLKIDQEKIKYYQLIDQFGYYLDIDKYNSLVKTSGY